MRSHFHHEAALRLDDSKLFTGDLVVSNITSRLMTVIKATKEMAQCEWSEYGDCEWDWFQISDLRKVLVLDLEGRQ